jgi:hypothetical protein
MDLECTVFNVFQNKLWFQVFYLMKPGYNRKSPWEGGWRKAAAKSLWEKEHMEVPRPAPPETPVGGEDN